MICFYHADNDGKCAGFWVEKLGKRDNFEDSFIKINYDIDFPFEKIHKNEVVYIVDYSIQTDEMDRLLEITPNVIWIDHHKSSIEKYANYDKKIEGLRYDGIAGCMLTYIYLGCMCHCDTKEVISEFDPQDADSAPLFTKLIADYDVWTFEYGDYTRRFEKGFTIYPHEPTDTIWEELLSEEDWYILVNETTDSADKDIMDMPLLYSICQSGNNIIEHRKSLMKTICDKKGFETNLDGYKCFAVNMPLMSSDDFIISNAKMYDLLISFSFNGKLWSYSIRSETVDCSELAAKYGGGGHKGAAGFVLNSLILEEK